MEVEVWPKFDLLAEKMDLMAEKLLPQRKRRTGADVLEAVARRNVREGDWKHLKELEDLKRAQ